MRLLITLIGFLALAACAAEDAPAPESGAGADAVRSAVEPPSEEVGSTASPAPTGTGPRVVFVGTSLTAGYGLDDPTAEAWPARVAELAREAGSPIRVVNGGVSGDTSAGGLRRLRGLLEEETAAVVIELGANDGLRGLPVDALRDNLDAAVDTVTRYAPEAGVVIVRMQAPPNLGPDYVAGFDRVFDDLDARAGVLVSPFILEGVAADPRLNQPDGIHPVAEGHRLMAERVWPTIAGALGEVPAGATR
jgi:acyl-CoA thioesterase-1